MRLQLVLIVLFLSKLSIGSTDEDKSVRELFQKYDQLMNDQKSELVDEVFTQKFIRDSGGKEAFIAKVKELPKEKDKNQLTWKKGARSEMIFAKLAPINKSKATESSGEFVVVRENGKLKIDGTASDGD
jgi:hypothetical protein